MRVRTGLSERSYIMMLFIFDEIVAGKKENLYESRTSAFSRHECVL